MIKILCTAAFLFSAANASSHLSNPEGQLMTFLESTKGCKTALVIGRTFKQGIEESKITDERLKNAVWLYMDPAGQNDIENSKIYSSFVQWPNNNVSNSIKGKFDIVAIDRWTLYFFVSEYLNQCEHPFKHQIELRVDASSLPRTSYKLPSDPYSFEMNFMQWRNLPTAHEINGKLWITNASFDAPYKFQDWLIQNNPREHQDLMRDLQPKIEASEKNYAFVRGIKEAYEAVKPGGYLFIGDENRCPSLTNIEALATILNINPEQIERVESYLIQDNERDGDPFLPSKDKVRYYHHKNHKMKSYFIRKI